MRALGEPALEGDVLAVATSVLVALEGVAEGSDDVREGVAMLRMVHDLDEPERGRDGVRPGRSSSCSARDRRRREVRRVHHRNVCEGVRAGARLSHQPAAATARRRDKRDIDARVHRLVTSRSSLDRPRLNLVPESPGALDTRRGTRMGSLVMWFGGGVRLAADARAPAREGRRRRGCRDDGRSTFVDDGAGDELGQRERSRVVDRDLGFDIWITSFASGGFQTTIDCTTG